MIKQLFFSLLLVGMAGSLSAQAAFPTPTLKTVDHQSVELADKIGNGQVTVVAVWATWCQPCHMELDHMSKYLDKWKNELDVQFLAISVDKRHMVNRIPALVSRKGWEYDILVDSNSALQSQLGFRSIPQMYIIDGDGKIVKEFSGYRDGREEEVDRMLNQLSSK
ncbi:TlpA disulfide reductase family protein [Lewinella sp. 4G2]|uniref:TlpA family protein disulfide reductase n=1 Tax=Lewinella sp. 4G2 TaxID=1803372 RepID=UPI0007B4DD86|nr:TlpA disulfide reductase family protein [Lewinella sp. 4G2]OAV44859.1 hypothetical protein A3850_010310 [Lewinella sp. 4G2]